MTMLTRKAALPTLAVGTILIVACGPPATQPVGPYDLPVKTSGGIDEQEQSIQATPLTVSVEVEDLDVAEELVGELESEVAFMHYSDLNGCESTSVGWETPFEVGTVVITFTLTQNGSTEDVQIALTTGDPPAALTKCLGNVVQAMQFAVAPGEGPVTIHLLLKYGD